MIYDLLSTDTRRERDFEWQEQPITSIMRLNQIPSINVNILIIEYNVT